MRIFFYKMDLKSQCIANDEFQYSATIECTLYCFRVNRVFNILVFCTVKLNTGR